MRLQVGDLVKTNDEFNTAMREEWQIKKGVISEIKNRVIHVGRLRFFESNLEKISETEAINEN